MSDDLKPCPRCKHDLEWLYVFMGVIYLHCPKCEYQTREEIKEEADRG